MSPELLSRIHEVLREARREGLDSVGQTRRAVADLLRHYPHIKPICAVETVAVAASLRNQVPMR